jgi:hypothetical protein
MKITSCMCNAPKCENLLRLIKDGNMIELTIFSPEGHHGIMIHKEKLLQYITELEEIEEYLK